MGNSLRCCLACILPCGALDLIRIVHLDGNLEEITRPVTAGQILQANPNHILSKPCSHQGLVRKILIVSPDSELQRGSIYFLLPDSSLREKKKSRGGTCSSSRKEASKKAMKCEDDMISHIRVGHYQLTSHCNRYLEDAIISEKKSSGGRDHHHRRRHSRSRSVSV